MAQNFITNAPRTSAYPPAPLATSVVTHNAQTPSFNDVLNRQIAGRRLQFSKHAAERLSERHVELTRDQIARVEDGLDRARGKGINDSLVLVDDVALVVNVRNNIVITAMGRQQQHTFSNIDGAVVV
ncbi:MAG: flagellar protein [Defluviitaleaceae bacterium]|nr:flagellar protein [Defluviitaleaceae bacterium]